MDDRIYLLEFGERGRYSLSYERHLRFQWLPSLYRFQTNGWHVYLWKFRFTRASRRLPLTTVSEQS